MTSLLFIDIEDDPDNSTFLSSDSFQDCSKKTPVSVGDDTWTAVTVFKRNLAKVTNYSKNANFTIIKPEPLLKLVKIFREQKKIHWNRSICRGAIAFRNFIVCLHSKPTSFILVQDNLNSRLKNKNTPHIKYSWILYVS